MEGKRIYTQEKTVKNFMKKSEDFKARKQWKGLARWRSGKESACRCKRCKRRGFNPWVRKIPQRSKQQPTAVLLPAESQGQRSLVGYSPQGRQESDTTEHALIGVERVKWRQKKLHTVVTAWTKARREKAGGKAFHYRENFSVKEINGAYIVEEASQKKAGQAPI